jgi:hypothetical protein
MTYDELLKAVQALEVGATITISLKGAQRDLKPELVQAALMGATRFVLKVKRSERRAYLEITRIS